jgi:polyisoprenoid-binding protein YceI
MMPRIRCGAATATAYVRNRGPRHIFNKWKYFKELNDMSARSLRILVTGLLTAGLLIGLGSSAFAQENSAKEETAESKTETLKIDPVHSNVLFRVQHADAGYVFGEFLGESGVIKFNPDNPEEISFELEVLADSIDTDNAQRDAHLKSADFFNAKQFPKLTFKSTSVEKRSDDTYEVTGDLTIHGQTQEVTALVQHTGSSTDQKGTLRRGFYTTLNIKRSDYGMDFMLGGGVDDNVKLIIAVEAVRPASK